MSSFKEDYEYQKQQAYLKAYEEQYKPGIAAGKLPYDEAQLKELEKLAGITVTPPTEMPLPPELTVGARRQGAARKRSSSRGRASTIMTVVGLGEERDSLG